MDESKWQHSEVLSLSSLGKNAPSILCFGAHCDDIEIGCGGTLLKLAEEFPEASIRCVVFSSDDEREAETRNALGVLCGGFRSLSIDIHRFRNAFFPSVYAEIKDQLERTAASSSPDIVFTHFRTDRHQDHRVVSELTWNSFRNHLILEYEIPKYDGDLGQPNCFVRLREDLVCRKVDCILESFPSQHGRSWFRRETFEAILQLRGIECNASRGGAEAFHARKISFLSE